MPSFIFFFLFSVVAIAKDDQPINHSGVYKVTSAEACESSILFTNCLKLAKPELYGYAITIDQFGDRNKIQVCMVRNFVDGLFNRRQSCYNSSANSTNALSISGAGFKGELFDKDLIIYSKFRRSGNQYKLTEGAANKGIVIYYNYTLEK